METPHPSTAIVHPITPGLAAGDSPAAAPVRVDLPPDQLARVKRSEARAERCSRVALAELAQRGRIGRPTHPGCLLGASGQIEARVGFRKSKIYALAKDEPLLRPVRISARCVAWPESRIEAFIAKVIARSDGVDVQGGAA
jgi:predicted DNA-binding transcriptional regulator AlpA